MKENKNEEGLEDGSKQQGMDTQQSTIPYILSLQREVMVTEVLRVEGTRRQPLVSHE